MADSRHTRAGGGYRTRRTLRSDAFWIASKQAVAREGEIETGSGGIDTDFEVKVSRMERRALRGTVGDGRARIKIESGSGNVRLLKT